MDRSSTTCLQPLFLPELCGVSAPLLYFRGDYVLLDKGAGGALSISGEMSTDTYFNAFPIGKWRAETNLVSLQFTIKIAQGGGELLVMHRDARSSAILLSCALDASRQRVYTLDVPIDQIVSGIVFWSVRANPSLVMEDARYSTTCRPLREVRFGIAVPAFNRDAEIKNLIERFEDSRLPEAGHALYVIDNGRTLSGAHVLHNSNAAGGTGGFTRGLLQVRDNPGLTHVLFMDDDAPSPLACIEKAAAFLKFVRTDNLAIAGSMLVLEAPSIQYGAGLRLKVSTPTFLKAHRDMTDPRNVVIDGEDESIDAGGWYFFAFPAHGVTFFPFPFFVRGDDVLFSLQNDFRIVTVTGIACWQASFEEKITPSTTYLAYRARFLNGCLMSNTRSHTIDDVFSEILAAIYSNLQAYRYGIANAIIDGVEDILVGPTFFEKNTSAIARLSEIEARYSKYYPKRVSSEDLEKYTPVNAMHPFASKLLRRARWLLADGHRFAGPARPPALIEGFACCPDLQLLGHKEALFWSKASNTGFVAKRSIEEYREVIKRTKALRNRFRQNGRQCIQAYQSYLPQLQSEKFWRKTLGLT